MMADFLKFDHNNFDATYKKWSVQRRLQNIIFADGEVQKSRRGKKHSRMIPKPKIHI